MALLGWEFPPTSLISASDGVLSVWKQLWAGPSSIMAKQPFKLQELGISIVKARGKSEGFNNSSCDISMPPHKAQLESLYQMCGHCLNH